MHTVYILLGGNLGKVQKSFQQAIRMIEKNIGRLRRQSSLYKTAAWGLRDQPDFLNQVIIIDTPLNPAELMEGCLRIEKEMGRTRLKKNAPRNIDIDILFYDKEIIETRTLIIPHPRIAVRRFVLVPLHQLSPNFKHPVFKKTIHQLLLNCPDELTVEKI